ncbi:uncharacterized protein A1O9_07014 [Exophiala aquamarina CBS 119918]|uniref:Elongation of fatty acids protein n=1 Tax=Exophiala aquamarina CBS 119918 TaxID=1182545 RepID=A0A072P9Q3_9EURO|nr:uncharacterized protein A1O9_07014 [Exophiala aquamarina CBS 119918]KEF56824.1 hypothetical protein A1O9_07014 [Exophiala aquamarina CBS 119918]
MSVTQLKQWLHLDDPLNGVKATTLPAAYFKFPPSPEPTVLPPPIDHSNLAHPFTIQPDIYNALLSAHVPITVALVYASIVTLLNSVNRNRKYKPWAVSRTGIFKLFVILHNIFLAVYSAWTFVGMLNALRLALPAWKENTGVAETLDALCKLHGPRGHGNAAAYNTTTSAWGMTNRGFHLAADGLTPEPTDVGRIWNEGLAFYGWIFYLSKFYEVIDTFIILAKGKKSSFLQTYHHAGAMLCMWAGIRYMSPPIWMFVLVNSAIHAIMYTFYLMSTIGVTVPKWFKQSLTTLQITQFVIGASYAFAHLFVAYQIPVSVPYLYRLGSAASTLLNSAPSDVSSAASVAVSTASAGTGAWLKKIALRAAGHEGLAENVLNEQGRPFGIDAVHIAEDLVAKEETRYRDEMQWVNCLDTSGQVFAILLNCLYLLPLTWLFAQFFITSYLKRVERRRSSTASEIATTARLSLRDASKGVARRLSEAVEEMHSTAGDIGDDAVLVDGDEIKRELSEAIQQAKSRIAQGTAKAKNSASGPDAEKVKQEVQRDLEKVRKNVQGAADKVVEPMTDKDKQEQVQAKAQTVKDTVAEAVEAAADNVKPAAEKVVETTKSVSKKASEQLGGGDNSASRKADTATEGEQGTRKTASSASSPEEQDSPNEDGTGAGGATGGQEVASSSEGKTKDTSETPSTPSGSKKRNKKNKKKAEDKIIDESKVVRDEDVDTKPSADGNKEDEEKKADSNETPSEGEAGGEAASEVREGTSFADAVKE